MAVLGVRCSNKDFTYAVLDGKKAEPKLLVRETLTYPAGFSRPQSLYWLFQEVNALSEKHKITKIVIKRFEGRTRGQTFEDRVEYEAAVMLSAGSRGSRAVFKKVKSTIAKDLGQKGRAKYLANLDTSPFPNFPELTEKEKDAIQAAWSELI